MSIISFQFLLFGFITVGLYFTVPKKVQWVVICTANIVFYAFSGVEYLIYVVFTSAVTFWTALKLEDIAYLETELISAVDSADKKIRIRTSILYIKKQLCGIAVALAMGVWIIRKYTNFLINNINLLAKWVHLQWQKENVSWVLPLGISFYTFHAVGYLIDVYRSKYKAERNFAKYFTFVSYFPHITQGPFSRFDQLGRKIIEKHSFSYDRLCQGCSRILWGVFKKLIVADKTGIVVTEIFTNSRQYTGEYILFAVFLYNIRIYADFSGYMDIMCGISNVFGINLSENFRQPYFSRTIDEFWRRWHITLGKWFKDYMFYPISMGNFGQTLSRWARKRGGSKMAKLIPGYFALIVVWSATGLWHGARWSYLIWGYLNLLMIFSAMQFSDIYKKIKIKLHINSACWSWQLFCILRTFVLVSFFRLFSIGVSLRTTFSMLKTMIVDTHLGTIKNPKLLFAEINKAEICGVVLGVSLIFVVDILNEKEKWNVVKAKCPMIFRNAIYAGMILFIMILAGGSSDLTGDFMYANF